MKALRQALEDNRSRLLSYPNVVGVGLGYKVTAGTRAAEPALVVFVTRKLPSEQIPAASRIPKRVAGLPTDVVEVGRIRIHNERLKKHRPAPPGVSISHPRVSAGTFGAVVYARSTGLPFILSNNHVLANETDGADGRAKVGDPIVQPGVHDGGDQRRDTIGRLFKFVPLHFTSQESTCRTAGQFEKYLNALIRIFRPNYFIKVFKQGRQANLVDAALAEPLAAADIVPDILEIGPVQGVAEAELGTVVKKSGRTTGLTHGQVEYVATTITVQFSDGRTAVFEDQFLTTAMSKPGDSGSLVLSEKNQALGLLFAGSNRVTICNRIQNVLRLFDVTF
jgi:hypothetical protein